MGLNAVRLGRKFDFLDATHAIMTYAINRLASQNHLLYHLQTTAHGTHVFRHRNPTRWWWWWTELLLQLASSLTVLFLF